MKSFNFFKYCLLFLMIISQHNILFSQDNYSDLEEINITDSLSDTIYSFDELYYTQRVENEILKAEKIKKCDSLAKKTIKERYSYPCYDYEPYKKLNRYKLKFSLNLDFDIKYFIVPIAVIILVFVLIIILTNIKFKKKKNSVQEEKIVKKKQTLKNGNIEKELSKGNFRMAIQIVFFRTLNTLERNKQIKIETSKTPIEYYMDLCNSLLKKPFKQMIANYLISEYANMNVTREMYDEVNSCYNDILSIIRSKK